jgi:hypothetical protein
MAFWSRKERSGRRSKDDYIKIVFFDGISIEDYLKVRFGGERIQEVLDTGKTSTDMNIGSELSGQAGGKTKALGGLLAASGLRAKARRQASRQRNMSLKSTFLTDYLELFEKDKYVHVFRGYDLEAYGQSMTHFKMMAPYVSIVDGKLPVDEAGEMHIDLKSFNKSLDNTRGYLEMIGKKDGKPNVVLRFKNEAFYNGYSLYDITKMDLVFHAIKVGTSKEAGISFVDEITKITNVYENEPSLPEDGFTNSPEDNPTEKQSGSFETLDVYDVVFAGVVASE